MRYRDLNSFDNLNDLVNFLGDPNRVGRNNTWIAKNYNTEQLIKDLRNILDERPDL